MSVRKLPRSGAAASGRRTAGSVVPGVRRRRTPEEARSEILTAARKLMLDEGPAAVTLQRLASEIGMSHSNLLHHFGSAGELQSALIAKMVSDLNTALNNATTHLTNERTDPRALVDFIFDAYDKSGAGQLAAWIALSRNFEPLEGLEQALGNMVDAFRQKFQGQGDEADRGVSSAVLLVSLMAFADSLIGERLRDLLDRERTASRKVAASLLPVLFEAR